MAPWPKILLNLEPNRPRLNIKDAYVRLEGHSSSGCDIPAQYLDMHCSKLFRIIYCNFSRMMKVITVSLKHAIKDSEQF